MTTGNFKPAGASLDVSRRGFIDFISAMTTRSTLSFFFGLCLVSVGARAAVSLDGLASESPFMPKAEEEVAAPVVTENAAVEFRGIISTKEGVFFGLYDRTRNLASWVKQDEKGADFNVRSYDAASDLVTVDYQGQKYTLPLSMSKVSTAVSTPVPVVNMQPTGGNRVVAVPGVRVDDQRRLESVAAEVRRRRALRQAA